MSISRIFLRYAIPGLLVPLCSLFLVGQTDARALAGKVDQRYNHMRTLEAQFTETYTGAGMSRTESGTLLMKKPGRMRWDYDQPRPKLFLTDGNTAWFYVPGERQARRTPVKQLEDLRSPLRYLLGKAKLEKELDGLSLVADAKALNPSDVVLRGVPKGMRERVAQTLLEITPEGLISRIVVEELDGSVTEFDATVRIDTPQEVLYYQHGGILQYVLRQLRQNN